MNNWQKIVRKLIDRVEKLGYSQNENNSWNQSVHHQNGIQWLQITKSHVAPFFPPIYYFLRARIAVLIFKGTYINDVRFFGVIFAPHPYSLINRRQLHIFCTQAKTWHRIFCWFTWISLNFQVLAGSDHKIVLFWSSEQFFDHIMQELGNSGKFR